MNEAIKKHAVQSPGVFFDGEISYEQKLKYIAEQQEIDSQETESRWAKIAEKIGNDEVYRALREYFECMFNGGVLNWVGSLFDTETGMFYASLSGKRANVLSAGRGYYPHPEATATCLRSLMNTGALRGLDNDYSRVLPELVKYKITYYLKSIQGDDGEFYVSQINKSEIAPNRAGRDRDAASSLFNMLKTKPTYSFNKHVGDGIDGETYWANLVSEGKVTEADKPFIYWATENLPSARGAVSAKEQNTEKTPETKSGSQISAIFESHDTFIDYLLTKDPYNTPYSAISNLNSIAGSTNAASARLGAYNPDGAPDGVAKIVPVKVGDAEKQLIVRNGDTLNDINVSWMNLYVNEAGLFGKVTNNLDSDGNPVYDGFFGGWGFNNSNGFMKSMSRYNSAAAAFPEPRLAVESLLKGINNPECAASNGNVLVVYNVWVSLWTLRSNIRAYYKGDDKEELLDYIQASLFGKVDKVTGESIDIPYVALAIKRAYEQVQPFKKVDGGYGHSTVCGTSGWQGSLPTAISADNLSDADATFCTMTSLSTSICGVLGLDMSTEVPMYAEADLYRCLLAMSEQPRLIKKTPAELLAESGEQ